MGDKMREEFEVWFNETGRLAVLADTLKDADGNYYFAETRLLWSAWQASRQALVVELPHTVYRGDYLQDGTSNLEWEEYYEIDEIKSLLDSAGIKWTE